MKLSDPLWTAWAILGLVVVSGCSLVVPTVCSAGPNANAKILIHVGPPRPAVIDHVCTNMTAIPNCSQVVTAGGLYPPNLYRYVYLLVTDGDVVSGVGALECGVRYTGVTGQGVDIFAWDACADQEARVAGPEGPWPASGSGNLLYWDVSTRCQRFEPGGSGTGVVALGGYFYVGSYTPDTLAVTVNPGTTLAAVANCAGIVDVVAGGEHIVNPSHLGYAVFSSGGSLPGYNPCGLNTPVKATTWSRIKSTYQ
jgi:hypothetical protein